MDFNEGEHMKRVLLYCNGGFSTSILADKINTESKTLGIEVEASANDILNIEAQVNADSDIIVLGPQVSHREAEIKQLFPNNTVIQLTMQEFGMMNPERIFVELGE